MAMENPPFLLGDTSSNGGFSIVMLVFLRGYMIYIPWMDLLRIRGFEITSLITLSHTMHPCMVYLQHLVEYV